jgi:hypothetical protein
MRTRSGLIALLLSTALPAVICLTATDAGAIVNIQNLGASARSTALGNAFVAVADNGDAVFANPAGLATVNDRQLGYTNVSLLFSGIDGDNLGQHVASFTQPLGEKMALGVGYERIGSDMMSENGAFVSLAYSITSDLQLGVTTKYLFWSVEDFDSNDPVSGESAGSIGVDVGALWQTPMQNARLGLMVKNVLQPKAICDCGKAGAPALESGAGDIPMDLAGGASYQLENSLVSVQWSIRDLTGDSSESRLVVGGETKLVEGLMLRGGGSRIFEEDASGDLNAGLGYRWNQLLFDYGYHIPLDLTETNGSHRFSLVWQL